MEARYTNRFRGIAEVTGDHLKARDSAGNLTEIITSARGSLSAQHGNIRELFSTSVEMVSGIDTHQQLIGTELVKNMPKPTAEITASPGRQLGYIQLTSRFLQAGMLHFMEQTYNAQQRIRELEKMIETLAQYDQSMDLIGQMVPLDIDTLESAPKTAERADSVTESPSPTPTKASTPKLEKTPRASKK